MAEKIRLLFYGDAPPVATGFATVSRNILMGLHNTGKYEITVLGVNHWGDPHEFPFPIWPIGIGGRDPYGRQRATDMMLANDLQFDLLFMLQDSFILDFMRGVMPRLKSMKNFTSVCYYPIDGIPKRSWVESMAMFDHCVTYTKFGKKESILAHPPIAEKLQVIPHGINTDDFYPMSDLEVQTFRTQYFGRHASKFIVTNVNRNQQRKDIPRTLMAFKEFRKRRPNSVLYLHMAAQDQGWNLPEVIQSIGLRVGEDVLMPGKEFGPNKGYPIEIVNCVYNASDVIVSTTLGEGWGLSSIEAMATKTPIIFPDNTSLREIIGSDRGFLVKSGETLNDHVVIPSDNEVLRPLTSVTHMAETLMKVHDDKELAKQRAENAYKWVNENLTWDKHIVPQWDALFTKVISEWAKKSMQQSSGNISSEEL